jgi:hypothetical protein
MVTMALGIRTTTFNLDQTATRIQVDFTLHALVKALTKTN